MASREFNSKTGKARLFFRYGGKQFNRTIAVQSDKEALRVCALIEETIQDLKRGKLVMPAEDEPVSFIVSGGKVDLRPQLVSDPFHEAARPPTLKHIFDTYAAELTPGSKEANSIETEAVHLRHMIKIFGESLPFDSLSVNVIQKYVDERAHDGVGSETIRKELSTLRMISEWAHKREYVAAPVSWKRKDLTFPKEAEKPPFQTWEQVTRRIERGGLSKHQVTELWECLWLDEGQTTACLAWVREHARYPFTYPAFAFAAFTGARRSEILRSEREVWDFRTGVVSIRQKKADKSKTFTRRTVHLHPALTQIMSEWFEVQPVSTWTICTTDGSPIMPRMATKYFRASVPLRPCLTLTDFSCGSNRTARDPRSNSGRVRRPRCSKARYRPGVPSASSR
jgi:integrase